MNLGGHIGAGWLIAHSARLDRFERRWVVAMAVLCDVDGVFLLWRGSLDTWHRTFGHNIWVWMGAPLAVVFFASRGRKLLLLALCYGAMASHVVLDLVGTGWWPLYPLWPFNGPEILMSDYIPENTMKYVIQPVLLVAFIAGMVWIYLRHRRTPVEAISPNLDRLLTDFVLLPWRRRCAVCGKRAFYRCSRCGRHLCPDHRRINLRLEVFCRPACPDDSSAGGDRGKSPAGVADET